MTVESALTKQQQKVRRRPLEKIIKNYNAESYVFEKSGVYKLSTSGRYLYYGRDIQTVFMQT